MKIILMQEVKGKGGEGDVVDVARGYAVNYLFPHKMAIEATPGNLKQLESRVGKIREREETRVGDANGLAASLEGKIVTIPAKVGEEGRLFGSITSQMIEAAIDEQLDVGIDRRKIDVHGHIKELGEHTVTVQVYRDIKASVTVKVIGEGQAEPILDFDEDVEAAEEKADEEVSDSAEEVAEEVAEETPAESEVVENEEASE